VPSEKFVIFPAGSNLGGDRAVRLGVGFVDIAPDTSDSTFSKTSEGHNYFDMSGFRRPPPNLKSPLHFHPRGRWGDYPRSHSLRLAGEEK